MLNIFDGICTLIYILIFVLDLSISELNCSLIPDT